MNAAETVYCYMHGTQPNREIRSYKALRATMAKPKKRRPNTAAKLFKDADTILESLYNCTHPSKKHKKKYKEYAEVGDWAFQRLIGPYATSLENELIDGDSYDWGGDPPSSVCWALRLKRKSEDEFDALFVIGTRMDALPKSFSPTGPGWAYCVDFIYDDKESGGSITTPWFCTVEQNGKIHPCVWHKVEYRTMRGKRRIKTDQGRRTPSSYVPYIHSTIYDPVLEWTTYEKKKGWRENTSTSAAAFGMAMNMYANVDANILVRVSDHRGTVNLTIPMEEAKRIFKSRIKVKTKSGRTKPIIHWVASHTRVTGANVKTHWRGLKNFQWEGLTVAIHPPDKDRIMLTSYPMLCESGLGFLSKLMLKTRSIVNPATGEVAKDALICDPKQWQDGRYYSGRLH